MTIDAHILIIIITLIIIIIINTDSLGASFTLLVKAFDGVLVSCKEPCLYKSGDSQLGGIHHRVVLE